MFPSVLRSARNHRELLQSLPAWLILGGGMALNFTFLFGSLFYWFTASSRGEDSWGPMRRTYTWFVQPHSETIYQFLFFHVHLKFQYPPSSLLLFVIADALHLSSSNIALNWISWFAVGIQAIAGAGLAWVVLQKRGYSPGNRWDTWLGLGMIALLSIAFYPVIGGYAMGQIQTWLNTLFVLAGLAWICKKRFLAGLLIGFICLFKPQLGLFLIWALLRKQGRFLLGWSVGVIPAEMLALSIFGLKNHLDYLNALQFLSRHGESVFTNQSVNGLLNRFIGNISVGNTFPAENKLVYVCTVCTSALLILFALFYRVRAKNINVLDLFIAGLIFTLASPIAWQHHYGILSGCLVVPLMMILTMKPGRRRAWLLLLFAVDYSLCAYPPHPEWFSATGWGSVFESTLFFGVLGVLWMLCILREKADFVENAKAI